MYQFIQPSYTPSIPTLHFELCKYMYQVSSSTIPYIKTYLKPSNQINGLEECIDIANRITLTKDEWDMILMDNASKISGFFTSGSIPLPKQQQQREQQVINYINQPKHEEGSKKFVIIDIGTKSIVICCEEWWCLNHLLNCLDSRLRHLTRVKGYYENRINFFRKQFKLAQPKTISEAYAIMENVYDEMSTVDQEIKCFVIDYLFRASHASS